MMYNEKEYYYIYEEKKIMKVFISWSGDRSKEIANVFKEFLPLIIQEVDPFVSSIDIEKGNRWSSDIASQLEETNFGILCVTSDNVNSPWLNFEAGALSKSIDTSKVCPFLFDLQASDLTGTPLTQFQLTVNNKNDILNMFKSLNNSLDQKKLDENSLEKIFDRFWNSIEDGLSKISKDKSNKTTKKDQSNKVLEEILKLLNNQNNLLNNPEKLLPVDYLRYIFERSGVVAFRQNRKFFLPFNESDLRRMEMAVTMIKNQGFHTTNIDIKSTVILLSSLLKSIDSSVDFLKLNKGLIFRDSEQLERYFKLRDSIAMTIEVLENPKSVFELDNNMK